jgi:NAD(P)-dependent dehydrogenase (short-subunit alcohol dehydrogenase family)
MTIFDFSDKAVFVAGGTTGINLGIAEAFAAAKARVAVMSRSAQRVDQAVQQLRSIATDQVVGFSADVRNAEATAGVLNAVHERFGPIDVIVSGAAGNFPATAAQMSANAFKAVVDIDLLGTFNVLRSAYPLLRKPGASVLNISAPQATIPMALQAHACAAKAGVEMLTRVLAVEWGGEGIRVNAVVPGPIEGTEGMARLAPSEDHRLRVAAQVPLRRFGTKQDVSNLVLFLCSEFASYISGAVVAVDGGWVANGARGLA